MKKLLLVMIFTSFVFAGVWDKLAKNSLQYFKPSQIEIIGKQYGENGIKVLDNLSAKYGKNALNKFNNLSNEYGKQGIKIVSKYGDDIPINKNSINMISKYGDKGYYLTKQYPTSINHFKNHGDNFIKATNKYGDKRVIKYLDDSAKHGKDDMVLKLLDKYGDKANNFFQQNWGKLTTIGFVTLNSNELIASIENIGKEGIKTVGETTTQSVDNVANSNLGILIGIALIIFIILKFGWDKLVNTFRKSKKEQ